jgi:hypothetical protein
MLAALRAFNAISTANRVSLSCLLFWLAAGSMIGWDAVRVAARGWSALWQHEAFFAVSLPPGSLGFVVAASQIVTAQRRLLRVPTEDYDEQAVVKRNRTLAVLLALANAFPLAVLALAWTA